MRLLLKNRVPIVSETESIINECIVDMVEFLLETILVSESDTARCTRKVTTEFLCRVMVRSRMKSI